MYKIVDYHTNKVIAKNIKTKQEAKNLKNQLLKEKTKNNTDETNYNWLLLIIKQSNK